ncbi:MAG TPA: ComEA family DNA-binding protein [Ornithinibacter sp.]|nr:ComEA family DNA-binding protein [Ornithinibacter sp.]
MPRRPPPEPISPRALARLRSPRGGFVPTARDLDPDAFGHGAPGRERVGDERAGRHGRAPLPREWVRLPSSVAGARWHPGRGAVLGAVVVALLAVAVFGLRVALARTSGEGTVIAPGGGSRAGPAGVSAGAVPVGVPGGVGSPGTPATPTAGATGGGAVAPGATASAVVVVHVVGEVRRPGVQRLALGSRVQDAVDAAGGATGDADLARVNLARVLVDGEQVQVPAPGDPDPSAGGAGGGVAGGAGVVGGSAGSSAPVSINTADLDGLDTLPGVGPVLAQRILDWRTQHGRFTSVEELGEVSGIGEKLLAQLRPLVTV